jgi:hypothetical protein
LTEWIARNILVKASWHGFLGLTHVRAKVKAIRLMQAIQVLKEPDKESSLLARPWLGIRICDWFFETPIKKVAFVLECNSFYKK